jgi:hypothetical protein
MNLSKIIILYQKIRRLDGQRKLFDYTNQFNIGLNIFLHNLIIYQNSSKEEIVDFNLNLLTNYEVVSNFEPNNKLKPVASFRILFTKDEIFILLKLSIISPLIDQTRSLEEKLFLFYLTQIFVGRSYFLSLITPKFWL